MPSPIGLDNIDPAHLATARIVDKPPSPAREKDTVQVVISLPREVGFFAVSAVSVALPRCRLSPLITLKYFFLNNAGG